MGPHAVQTPHTAQTLWILFPSWEQASDRRTKQNTQAEMQRNAAQFKCACCAPPASAGLCLSLRRRRRAGRFALSTRQRARVRVRVRIFLQDTLILTISYVHAPTSY